MRKDQVKLSEVHDIPVLTYANSFDQHMQKGDKSGQTHSGLHLLSLFKKSSGSSLSNSDIARGQEYAGRLDGRATTVTIKSVDARASTFTAAVNIYGVAKTSTFFPVSTSLSQAKDYIQAAWKDHCTYGTTTYGGRDVDIYKQMRTRYGLNWVGMVSIGGQQVWVGSPYAGSVVTAFPAVNNKFS